MHNLKNVRLVKIGESDADSCAQGQVMSRSVLSLSLSFSPPLGHTLSKRLLLSMKGVEIQELQSLWARVHSCKYVSVFFFFFLVSVCLEGTGRDREPLSAAGASPAAPLCSCEEIKRSSFPSSSLLLQPADYVIHAET